jgi:hypothetical protein
MLGVEGQFRPSMLGFRGQFIGENLGFCRIFSPARCSPLLLMFLLLMLCLNNRRGKMTIAK